MSSQHLSDLPVPVRRFLEHVLPKSQPAIRRLRMKQTGQLRTSTHARRWHRFQAEQVTHPATVGYVWNARVGITPLLHVRVRDAYLEGQASSQVRLLSVIPVGRASSSVELNAGALHRFLAEAAWYPTALLPGAQLRWSPIDDNSALATLTDAGITVSLEFRFNDAHEIAVVYTPSRWQTVAGGYRQTPWEGRFHSYRQIDGLLVPSGGEVGWYHGGDWQKVWTGTVIEAAYEI